VSDPLRTPASDARGWS